MNPLEFYDADYLAGFEGDDACPYVAFTFPWWCWHAGHAVGHHTICSLWEATLHFEQD